MARLYPLSTNLKFVFFFNISSFTVWFCCLGRFLILLPLVGRKFLPGGIADFFHVVSLCPLCGFFVIKSLVDKQIRVADVFLFANGLRMAGICYGVIFPHPKVAKHTTYSILILSWCVMYVIHFAYYSFKVKTRRTPSWLFWLEYHHFYVTFPLAIVAEMVLIFLSLAFVEEEMLYGLILKAVLIGYIPGGYLTWQYLCSRKNLKYDTVIEKRRQSSSLHQDSTGPTVASISSRNQFATGQSESRDN